MSHIYNLNSVYLWPRTTDTQRAFLKTFWAWADKFGQGTHSTKMVADKSAENTQNGPKIFGPICLPKPKSLGFSKKALSGCL